MLTKINQSNIDSLKGRYIFFSENAALYQYEYNIAFVIDVYKDDENNCATILIDVVTRSEISLTTEFNKNLEYTVNFNDKCEEIYFRMMTNDEYNSEIQKLIHKL